MQYEQNLPKAYPARNSRAFQCEDFMDFLPGIKTFIGLAFTLMGTLSMTFHWTWWNSISPDAQAFADQVVMFGGLAFAFYGKVMAALRERKMKASQ